LEFGGTKQISLRCFFVGGEDGDCSGGCVGCGGCDGCGDCGSCSGCGIGERRGCGLSGKSVILFLFCCCCCGIFVGSRSLGVS